MSSKTVVRVLALSFLTIWACAQAQDAKPKPPVAGPVEIFPLDQVRIGMKGLAWTTFEGHTPESFPVEVIGFYKNQWGPNQDIIMVKVGGRAFTTGVAGGMSGSPVYIDGKLMGALSLRFGQFLNEPVGGVTPAKYMLDITEKDGTRPPVMVAANGKLPLSPAMKAMLNPSLAGDVAGASDTFLTPIETPVAFTGFNEGVVQQFADTFRQLGLTPSAAGGASAAMSSNMPTRDPAKLAAALPPGAAVSMVLMDGDFSMASGCTVTYNDLKHVLICGHSFLNYGKLDMPMSTAEVITTLGSAFQPTKILNAEEVVGTFVQDRHNGMLGLLGEAPHMIPVEATVHAGASTKTYHLSVFQNAKFTPFMMTLAAFNTLLNINEYGEDITYHTKVNFQIEGYPDVNLEQLWAAPENAQVPAPMLMAFWLGERFGRIFSNSFEAPNIKSVKLDFEMLPERRIATIEHLWVDKTEVHPGDEVNGRVFLRQYRGERITKDFKVRIPVTAPRGDIRIMVSDADYVNRYHAFLLQQNHAPGLREIVKLLNQEQANGQLFISLIYPSSPTGFLEDKIMPSLPSSVASVMDAGRTANRMAMTSESALFQESIPVDRVLNGLQTVTVTVK